jgi:uncharacterized membrane protein YozB (DUF420 family)
MTTGLAQGMTAKVARGASDRVFFTGIAAVMALTVLAGFGTTYYFRLPSGTPTTLTGGSITPTLHLHALLFTGWVLLFLVQTGLIAARRVAVHRRLGFASIALAAAMVVVGLRTAIESAARGAAPPGADPLTFLVVPVFDLVLFTGFVSAAILKRRDKEAHKRLMLLAYVSIITAAIARMPGVLPLGPLVFFGASFLFVVAGMVYDRIWRGRIHRAYAWGAPIIALSVPVRLAVSGTAAWQAFARWLTAS